MKTEMPPPVIERRHRPEPEKKKRKWVAPTIFIIFALIVGAFLTTLWVNREDITRVGIEKFWAKMFDGSKANADGGAEVINLDAQRGNILKIFEGGIAVLTGNRLVCYDTSGRETFSAERTLLLPAMSEGGGNLIAYDRDGDTLIFIGPRGVIFDERWASPIITAKVNQNGWLALVTRGDGYRSVVTVYNNEGGEVYRYSSPGRYITDAAVSADGKNLAVVSAGYNDSWVQSRLQVFDMNSDAIPVGTELPMTRELFFGNGLCVLTDESVLFFTDGGAKKSEVSLAGRVVLDWTELATGLVLRTENALELYSWKDGTQSGRAELTESVVCQSGAGEWLTIVSSGHIQVFKGKDLKQAASKPNDNYARQALQQADGRVYLIENDKARQLTMDN
ncbi:hypothetical protein FACS1894217_07740 [Clostridia bacterium]|nr:hypothetical protein FACS1894217_07740 [Clostridia bacterium]